jgi:hypothetical protein
MHKTAVGELRDEDEVWKGTQESNERIKDTQKRGKLAGRARGGWLDAVYRDAKRMLKCRNWRRLAEDKGSWSRRIGETKAQVGRTLEEESTAIPLKLSQRASGCHSYFLKSPFPISR